MAGGGVWVLVMRFLGERRRGNVSGADLAEPNASFKPGEPGDAVVLLS